MNHTSLHLSHKKNSVGIFSQPPHLLHATQVLSSELDAVHQSVPNSGTQLCYGTALLWVFPKMHSTIYKVYIFCTIQKHVLRPVAPRHVVSSLPGSQLLIWRDELLRRVWAFRKSTDGAGINLAL